MLVWQEIGVFFSETNWYTYVIICKKSFPHIEKVKQKNNIPTHFFLEFLPNVDILLYNRESRAMMSLNACLSDTNSSSNDNSNNNSSGFSGDGVADSVDM